MIIQSKFSNVVNIDCEGPQRFVCYMLPICRRLHIVTYTFLQITFI